MEVYLKRTQSGLVALYDSDNESLRKLRIGDEVKGVLIKPRNYNFHKKFFALLNMAFENQDKYNSFDVFRAIMIMKSGFYIEVQTDKGLVFLPKSISFAKMDEVEFQDLYSRMVDQVIKLLECTEKDIEENIVNFL